MFVEISKDETVATFFDVCGVSGLQNDHFHFCARIESDSAFQSKNGSVSRKEILESGERTILLHLTPNFLERDETRFCVCNSQPSAKPVLFGTFCYSQNFRNTVEFPLFIFSEKPNGILTILEPFEALFEHYGRTNGRTNEGQAGPACPALALSILSPRWGNRPPAPIKPLSDFLIIKVLSGS